MTTNMSLVAKMIGLLSLFLTMSATNAETDALYSKTLVTIGNVITGDTIKAHCYSKDDDLGYHQLAYREAFSWSFRFNVIVQTKFYCEFQTPNGFGTYAVYDGQIERRCRYKCVWEIQAGGPCLQQQDAPLYCQPWKNSTDSAASPPTI